jgi:ATP-dependent DNA helicase DinG
MPKQFSPAARRALHRAVAEAGGNEVFFLGRTDDQRRVTTVEVLARGNRAAVPAIVQACAYGDVVIHNHPSGHLEPSAADLEIASRLGSLGVGFLIVDNPVENVYEVVPAFAPRREQPLDPAVIGTLLGPGGAVAAGLPGYEDRPEQLRMAFAVAEAFNGGRLAVIEAGTGTGKSLAYLVPAILWALTNGERVVISTNTINLQEQLIRKDLPFLRRVTGLDFEAVLVKGRANYLCHRRAAGAHLEPGLFEAELSAELQAIRQWGETSGDGSREDLAFVPREQVWEEVCCEADQCARVRCADYARCFFHQARRQAAQANLLVVNHALLLSDLALRLQTDNYSAVAVLPPFNRIVLDEAHHLEEVATRFFATQVTRFSYARVLNRLRHPRKPEHGLLPRLLEALARELPDSQDSLYRGLHEEIEGVLALRQALLDQAVQVLDRLPLTMAEHLGRGGADGEEQKLRVVSALLETESWRQATEGLRALARQTAELAATVRELLKSCELIPEEIGERLVTHVTDLRGLAARLDGIAGDLLFFIAHPEKTCAWFEFGRSRTTRAHGGTPLTRLCTAPLEVAEQLRQAIYQRFQTVVMTSATLAVGESFAYFRRRVGLDGAEAGRLGELLLPSPFDFSRQALVAIPADLPEPGRPGYTEALRDMVERAVLAADGRTFVLFTAYTLLRRIHSELAPVLGARGYRCLRQGEESRHLLLKNFAADATSVLFGTDSFWEGVDVPGRALELVIISRLPFKVPTEPVLEARAEAIEAGGGDPFMEFTVPQAVIKFKQGFGRLIRHRDDRGVVLILDSRVVKKGYGRIFLRSLPAARVVRGDSAAVMAEVGRFFAVPEVVNDANVKAQS